MKLRHLSETLDLSDDQQGKIKPTVEQESGEVGQILKNPVLTRNEKLSRFEKIVQSSDAKIKPLLSPAQLQKLLELRREQKEDVKTLIAQENRAERH
jgi:F0F1-type ATP synthase delta subunit